MIARIVGDRESAIVAYHRRHCTCAGDLAACHALALEAVSA